MAGCCGAEFTKYGLRPGCQSGKYARLFSSFTKPPPDMFETVSVPTRPSPKNDKYVSDYKMSLIHESLFEEIQEHPELLDATNAGMYPDCYHEHPVTRDCLARGEAPPLALALYTDGVRYTSPLNSNVDTTCGYWVINVASGKRHLLTELRGNRVCSCGCRGWCSSWVVLRYLKWCLECLATGVRPQSLYTGDVAPLGHPVHSRLVKHGPGLGFRAAVCWLKGDWADANKTHGIPAVTSVNNPCPYCRCTKADMHVHYSSLSLLGMPFPSVKQGDYDIECRSREVVVEIRDERVRALVTTNCMFLKGPTKYGLTVIRDVPELRLQSGDFAVPSDHLFIVRDLYTRPVPFCVQFWRRQSDVQGIRCGVAVHRSPIFSSSLGLEPSTGCAIDFMHTICFGTIQRLVSCALWRAILGDVYSMGGNRDAMVDANIRMMRDDLLSWYFEESVEFQNRLGDLTVRMLGGLPDVSDPREFGGSGMRLKAHETLVMLPFAVHILEKFPNIFLQEHLFAAGVAMLEFLAVLKKEPMRVAPERLQKLVDLMQLHLCRCELALVAFAPKHHFAAELVLRSQGC